MRLQQVYDVQTVHRCLRRAQIVRTRLDAEADSDVIESKAKVEISLKLTAASLLVGGCTSTMSRNGLRLGMRRMGLEEFLYRFSE